VHPAFKHEFFDMARAQRIGYSIQEKDVAKHEA
jgi:hypothetical protein